MHRRRDLWGPDGESLCSEDDSHAPILPRATPRSSVSFFFLPTADRFDPDRFPDERLPKYLVPNHPLTLALDGVGLMSGISVRVRGIVFPHSAVAVDRWCLAGHGDATPPSGGLGAGQGT